MKTIATIMLLIVCTFQATAQNKQGNTYILAVGVSEYANPSANLTYSSKDAAELYKLLRTQTSADKIKLLTNKSATRDNIMKEARRLFTQTTANDIVIFYFSGHGYQGGFVAHDGPLLYDELKKVFKETKANRKIIFADACMSGDMRTDETNNSSTNMGDQKVCLFLSSRSAQKSRENVKLRNGVFTYFLIAALRGGADADRNKIITARELFDFVNPKVKQQTNGEQVPVMWGKFSDDMEILNWNN